MSSRSSSKSGKPISGGGRESSSDPRALDDTSTKPRKTVFECDCAVLLSDFRTEIVSFFQEFTKSQQEISKTLHEEIKEIKTEIRNNNLTLDSVVSEQNHLKIEINNMKQLTNSIQQQIFSFEDTVSTLKSNNSSAQNPFSYDDTILELQDRCRREKNVILIGIPEPKNTSCSSRRENDKNEVMKMLKDIFTECPSSYMCFRLGKYDLNKNRPIKVCFDNKETAKYLLKYKNNYKEIRIFPDQTPYQQQHNK